MSTWINVDDEVMRNALQVMLGWWDTDGVSDLNSDFPVVLLEGLVEYLSEAGGCDHSVNICCCAEQEAVAQLKEALGGRKPCPRCHGEGFQIPADDDYPQPVSCPACHGEGYVPTGHSPFPSEVAVT